MRRIVARVLILAPALVGLALAPAPAAASICVPTDLFQDGHFLSALLVDPPTPVSGAVDALGCEIAVYYNALATVRSVEGADISNAIYYGVAVKDASGVSVESNSIHDIGDPTFDGSQHGVGVFFTGSGSNNGHVDGNTISLYQKNGMAMKDGADVAVTGNTVTGRGPQKTIAQNGIEFVHSTSPDLSGNVVSENIYTQTTSCTPGCVGSTTGVVSTGFLLFDTNFKNPGQVAPFNHAFENQVDYYVVNPR